MKSKNPLSFHSQTIANKMGRALAGSSLPEILLVITLVLARWWKNSDFSYPSEVALPIILFSILAIIIYRVYRFIFGYGLASHLSALLLVYSLYNYQSTINSSIAKQVLSILPSTWDTPFTQSLVMAILLAIVYGFIGWIFSKLLNRFQIIRYLQPYKVLLFAVCFIFVVQLAVVGKRLWEIRQPLGYQYKPPSLNYDPAKVVSKPDIYYLVFDRYASSETLKDIYNYDNSDLVNFLTQQGFVTRSSAYANYPFTMSSLSSTMSLNYLPEFRRLFSKDGEWQAGFAYRSVINNPPIAQTLKAHGYSYTQVSSWWDFTRLNINADHHPTISFRFNVLNKAFYLSDLERDIINKSILSPWLTKGMSIGKNPILKYGLDRNPRQNFEAQTSALKELAVRDNKTTPQFIFAHILSPHEPFIFKADGSDTDYSPDRNDLGIDEKVKYTNQVTYLNKRIKDLISHIRASSPNAAIVIQADEGPYPKQFRFELAKGHYYDPIDLPLPQMKQKFGILASYYLPGVDPEKTKQVDSSVNIFRFVLNNYLGYNLPLLAECNFSMGSKFSIYNYQLVTDKLTGRPAPGICEKYR